MATAIWLAVKAYVVGHWFCGDTETARGTMAAEDAIVEMDFRC